MDDEPYGEPDRQSIEVFVRAMADGTIRLVVDDLEPFAVVMSPDQAIALADDLIRKAHLSRLHTEGH